MAPMRAIGCLAVVAVAALAAGCSSSGSTSPSTDPFSGTWNVTFTSAPTGTSVQPSPWVLTITKSGALYTVTYGRLAWLSNTGQAADIDLWTETNSSTFAIQNDSLYLLAQDATKGCFLSVDGAFIVNTAQGSASAYGTSCTTGSFTWSARKQ